MGAANVEPAPLIAPDGTPEVAELLLDLLLLPQAVTPTASRMAAIGASQVRDLNGFSFIGCMSTRLPSDWLESVIELWTGCEKAVKAVETRARSGSRSQNGCG